MTALSALAGLPAAPPVPAAAPSPDGAAGGDFAGILDAAVAPKPAGAAPAPLPRPAKRAPGAAADELPAGTDEPGTRKRGPSAGGDAGPGSSPSGTLDIATLAQLAAALVPAASPTGSTAPVDAPSGGEAAATTGVAPGADAAVPSGAAPRAGAPSTSEATLRPGAGTGADATPPAASAPAAASASGVPAAKAAAVESDPVPALRAATSPALAAVPAGPAGSSDPARPAPVDAVPASADAAPERPAAPDVGDTSSPAPGGGAAGSNPQAVRPPRAAGSGTPVTAPASGQARLTAAALLDAASDQGAGADHDSINAPDAATPRPGADIAATTATVGDLAAIGQTTPAQQVVTALQSFAPVGDRRTSQTSAAASTTAGSPPTSAAATAGTGARTLTIQLDPGHLGPVSVTLRMRADTVDIQIAVSNPQALHLLERDRHVLSAAVEAMGGSGGSLHLAGAADGASPAPTSAFTPGDGSSRQGNSSDAASTGRGHRSAVPDDASQSDPDDPTAPPPAAAPNRSRDGSLYL